MHTPNSTLPFQDLLKKRYGTNVPPSLLELDRSNPVLEFQLAHKSVRHYKDKPLEPGTVETLAAAAQSASSSSNLQAWSMVAIQDSEHKSKVATLCGDQEFIRRAPLFFVFVADLARLKFVSDQEGLAGAGLEYFEMFLVAALDAALASQNAALSAESLGLGICYVGAARNQPRELAQLLRLPPRTIGLFGMTVGWPAENLTTTVKPRLPQPGLLHYETYSTETIPAEVSSYDEVMREFYIAQGYEPRESWSDTAAKRVAGPESLSGRHVLREILEERGFGLK